jgi:hypothetical protein
LQRPGVALGAALFVVAVASCGGGSHPAADAGPSGDGAAGSTAGMAGNTAGAAGSTGGAAGSDAGAAGSTGGAAGQAACGPHGTFGGGETSLTGLSATAAIVDEMGAPVAGQLIMLCGINLCEAPKVTGVDGKVTISTTLPLKRPAFRYGDGVKYAFLLAPLDGASTDFTTGGHVLATGKLSDKPGATLTAGASATSGAVTVTVAAGGTIGINGLVYDTPESQKLRAVALPLSNLGPVVASAKTPSGTPVTFSLVYGVSPIDTIFCPAAKVTVALPHATASPNDLGWAPGTAVELWVAGADVGQADAPYAGWAKMSDGVVSADGATVSTKDGAQQGFVTLQTFAIRKVP